MLTAVAVLAALGALVGGAALTAPTLRSPQERLEARLTAALDAADVDLADPVSLDSSGGDAPVYSGRLQVEQPDGTVAVVRVALRPATADSEDGADGDDPGDDGPPLWLFPAVECDARYPLTWLGDATSAGRTTRDELGECVSDPVDGGSLVTIAWRLDDGVAAADDRNPSSAGRQTWRIDDDGSVVWLHNGGGQGGEGAAGGMTLEQQRAVAGAEGLLDAP